MVHSGRGGSRPDRKVQLVTTQKKRFQTVDEYIESFPDDVRVVLQQVRQTIREAAPDAVEAISYQIPTFKLGGRYLVYFSGWKNHISLYPLPAVTGALDEELNPYKSGRGTLKFPLGQPVPLDLVRRVVAALIIDNEMKGKGRKV